MTLALNILKELFSPDNWLGTIFYGVIFFLIAVIISRLIRIASKRILLREENTLVDPTVVLFLTQFAQIAVYVVGLIIFFHIVPAFNKLGTALLTGVSVASVVFGLAAQNTLANLVAGCTLLLYRPFSIDDLIQVATPTGTEIGVVERLTLGYTMLRTIDDRLVIVPNSLMASQVSLNLNRRSLYVMAIIPVGVTDLTQAGKVRKALTEIAHHHPKVRRFISCHRQTLEDGSVILSLRVWCSNSAAVAEVNTDVAEEIRKRFAGENVVFLAPPPVAPPAPAVPKASAA